MLTTRIIIQVQQTVIHFHKPVSNSPNARSHIHFSPLQVFSITLNSLLFTPHAPITNITNTQKIYNLSFITTSLFPRPCNPITTHTFRHHKSFILPSSLFLTSHVLITKNNTEKKKNLKVIPSSPLPYNISVHHYSIPLSRHHVSIAL